MKKIIVFLVGIVVVIFIIYNQYMIKNIEINELQNYSKEEILKKIFKNEFEKNTFFLKFTNKIDKISLPFIEYIKINYINKKSIELDIKETKFIGCIFVNNNYIYIDNLGFVKILNNYKYSLPYIEGIEFKKVENEKQIKGIEKNKFNDLVSLCLELKKINIEVNKIKVMEDYFVLYIKNNKVLINGNFIEEKIKKLKKILINIKNKTGILDMRTIDDSVNIDNISFVYKEFKNKK